MPIFTHTSSKYLFTSHVVHFAGLLVHVMLIGSLTFKSILLHRWCNCIIVALWCCIIQLHEYIVTLYFANLCSYWQDLGPTLYHRWCLQPAGLKANLAAVAQMVRQSVKKDQRVMIREDQGSSREWAGICQGYIKDLIGFDLVYLLGPKSTHIIEANPQQSDPHSHTMIYHLEMRLWKWLNFGWVVWFFNTRNVDVF